MARRGGALALLACAAWAGSASPVHAGEGRWDALGAPDPSPLQRIADLAWLAPAAVVGRAAERWVGVADGDATATRHALPATAALTHSPLALPASWSALDDRGLGSQLKRLTGDASLWWLRLRNGQVTLIYGTTLSP